MQNAPDLKVIRECLIWWIVLVAAFVSWPAALVAQSPTAPVGDGSSADRSAGDSKFRSGFLPVPVSEEVFSDLMEHSPFLRTLNLPRSLILTGVAEIEGETVATMLDLDTQQAYVVSEQTNGEGWQLVELKGDKSDIETLTAQIRVAGSEIVSIRYEKAPPVSGIKGVAVSTRIGNGTPGGGTGPHGGPDPRVLTPDQLADARNAARNIKDGFQADGYADRQTIPPEVVSKISRLSVKQRESINVKMFEFRNRGLGMPERVQIYNRLLDRELGRK